MAPNPPAAANEQWLTLRRRHEQETAVFQSQVSKAAVDMDRRAQAARAKMLTKHAREEEAFWAAKTAPKGTAKATTPATSKSGTKISAKVTTKAPSKKALVPKQHDSQGRQAISIPQSRTSQKKASPVIIDLCSDEEVDKCEIVSQQAGPTTTKTPTISHHPCEELAEADARRETPAFSIPSAKLELLGGKSRDPTFGTPSAQSPSIREQDVFGQTPTPVPSSPTLGFGQWSAPSPISAVTGAATPDSQQGITGCQLLYFPSIQTPPTHNNVGASVSSPDQSSFPSKFQHHTHIVGPSAPNLVTTPVSYPQYHIQQSGFQGLHRPYEQQSISHKYPLDRYVNQQDIRPTLHTTALLDNISRDSAGANERQIMNHSPFGQGSINDHFPTKAAGHRDVEMDDAGTAPIDILRTIVAPGTRPLHQHTTTSFVAPIHLSASRNHTDNATAPTLSSQSTSQVSTELPQNTLSPVAPTRPAFKKPICPASSVTGEHFYPETTASGLVRSPPHASITSSGSDVLTGIGAKRKIVNLSDSDDSDEYAPSRSEEDGEEPDGPGESRLERPTKARCAPAAKKAKGISLSPAFKMPASNGKNAFGFKKRESAAKYRTQPSPSGLRALPETSKARIPEPKTPERPSKSSRTAAASPLNTSSRRTPSSGYTQRKAKVAADHKIHKLSTAHNDNRAQITINDVSDLEDYIGSSVAEHSIRNSMRSMSLTPAPYTPSSKDRDREILPEDIASPRKHGNPVSATYASWTRARAGGDRYIAAKRASRRIVESESKGEDEDGEMGVDFDIRREGKVAGP